MMRGWLERKAVLLAILIVGIAFVDLLLFLT